MFDIERSIFFPVEPQSALRSVRTQLWLTRITEEQALELEQQYQQGFNKLGKAYWWKAGKDGKIKVLKSPPNYVRTKKYLDKYMAYKDELRDKAQRVGFIMPEDAFFMWYFMPMPRTWTKKKKAAMAFTMHKSTKDCDNIAKGILDALAPRKNNFLPTDKVTDDRIISSNCNAKIYVPEDYEPGTLIIEYNVRQFLTSFFEDVKKVMGWVNNIVTPSN